MSQPAVIRILIVDDHAIVQQGLEAIINEEEDMSVIGLAKDGMEAIQLFRQTQPDVTLMDLRMPQMGGVEAITTICAEFKMARIIVVTTYDGDEDIYRGLRAGSKGYLLKDCKPNELRTAIRVVHNGQQYIPPHVGAKLAQRMTNPELTDRELDVLRLVAQGMSNLEIGAALSVTESTVKSNINRILSKLGAKDRTQATIIALKRGIASL
ncbi:MAG: response regulator transcription factor [Microcoleus sp. PH2017_40_RAT_O_B]|uniref:response regulator n=1 Tax=unclassified Microcoleus TaxID=2642155 RepID=UPI001DCADE77|nr:MULTISPECIES: response regulator transcription factor [unclassified Microcoleus]MCC3507651.1 response regulator transcription factor [Microcoleus sp. PH2017_17_BER_D_A]MCC3574153.1 response regulator transcription factor [Microcoleus sp. PH2017_34_RAT_O_A]MCC3587326.1 response regulator transcription factor [Microcoleus sp. PH2017_30_WIL_O_A]MCC3611656.1 response regulator transcription factor [Microcoleus sp. PH2017_40_RAT_O_B]